MATLEVVIGQLQAGESVESTDAAKAAGMEHQVSSAVVDVTASPLRRPAHTPLHLPPLACCCSSCCCSSCSS